VQYFDLSIQKLIITKKSPSLTCVDEIAKHVQLVHCSNNDNVLCNTKTFPLTDRDMGARHRARTSTIQIMRVEEVEASKTRRSNIKQFHVSTQH